MKQTSHQVKHTNTPGLQLHRHLPQAESTRLGPGALPPVLSGLELTQRLQTTLDLERILELFSGAIQGVFPHDGFAYDHPELGVHLTQGRVSRHQCSYGLRAEQEDVGTVVFLRGRKFQEAELEQLENLMAGLVYPLRNALLYRKALELAQTDPLTGIHNRTALERLLPREVAAFERGIQPLAMLVVDLDHFKQINDTLGHSAGDQVLQTVAHCLAAATRQSDLVFRSGGEEFVVLLHTADIAHGLQAGERIRGELENCHRVQAIATGFLPTASIGLAIAQAGDTPRSLFDRADQAMYAAKHGGRNRVCAAAPPTPPNSAH